MKAKFEKLIIPAGMLLAVPALAIEPPPDDAPPPAPVEAPADAVQEAPEARPMPEKGFLGVSTYLVPDMLAAHLDLPDGSGVLVRAVVPESPAALAGIEIHDVITRVNDEAVSSPAELTANIHNHKPGDELAVQLIHKGKVVERKVTLGDRPAELADAGAMKLDLPMLEGMPEAQRIRDAIEMQLRAAEAFPPNEQEAIPMQMQDALRQLHMRFDGALDPRADINPGDRPEGGIHLRHNATFRFMDANGSIEIKSVDGGKEVIVRDQANEIVWSGPWDTEQDKAAAPPDVRERLEKLNMDQGFQGGLRFNFRNLGAEDE